MLNDHNVEILADCYNALLDRREIPDDFKEGVIKIYKVKRYPNLIEKRRHLFIKWGL